MLTLGQGAACPEPAEESGITSGNCRLSSVHGQPVLPAGGGGSSVKTGQRITQQPTEKGHAVAVPAVENGFLAWLEPVLVV